MTDRLALPRRYRRELEALLREHVPDAEVWAYGSRVNGRSHEGSDLDLALRSPSLEPLDGGFYDLLEAIERSNIPILVQAHDWAKLPESFHKEIERDYVVLQGGANVDGAVSQSEWREVTLGDLCEFQAGSVFKLQYQGKASGHYPFIKVSDMNLSANEVRINESTNWVDQAVAKKIRAKPIPERSIVFAKIGEALKQNRLRMTVRPTIVDNNMMGAIPKTDIVEPDFLFYGMHQFDFGEVASGTALPYLTMSELANLPMSLPPLPEQRAIAHVLGTLDDKIELNRRMNETLEAMARALFKSWFVDFEPVRAKMEGRWRRGESLPGLPADLYDLFPDRLVDSELGEVPEGWEVTTLGEVANISSGKRPGQRFSATSHEAQIPLWGGNGPMGFVAKPLVESSILLTGRVGTLGSVFRITTPCWPSDNTLIVTAISSYFFDYLFYRMQMIDFDALNRGSTQPLLTQSDLKTQLVLSPTKRVLHQFHDFATRLFDGIEKGIRETRDLAAQRDALLPRLVSGEVRMLGATQSGDAY